MICVVEGEFYVGCYVFDFVVVKGYCVFYDFFDVFWFVERFNVVYVLYFDEILLEEGY